MKMNKENSLVCPVCSGEIEKNKSRTVEYPGKALIDQSLRLENICFCESCGLGVACPVLDDKKLDEYYSKGS